MLSTLRDYSSYFLWFVVITFVGFMAFSGVQECGSSPARRGILAEVNGQPITSQAFSLAVSRATQNRQSTGQELSDQDMAVIRDQTWQQLIGALLLEQEANRRDIRVTDEELVSFLQQYPPQDIQQAPVFHTNGEFDYNKYLAAMTNADPQWTQFWRSIESYWRPQLRQSKLQQQVISGVRVSEADLEDYYRDLHDEARVEFLLVATGGFNKDVGTPGDDELREVYEDEKPRYRRLERVLLEMAIWTRTPSASDREWARTQIDEVKRLLDGGADFAELADQYTMDPSGEGTGGDLGWFGRGAMVKPFEDAAYALEIGGISDPVETQFGWHLIKLEEKRPSESDKDELELRARHILIRPEVSQVTADSVLRVAQDLAVRVRDGEAEFTQAEVEAAGGTWSTPNAIQRTDNVPLVGPAHDVKAWAFGADAGDICDPIDEAGRFVVARLLERRPEGIAPIEEVRPLVMTRWITKRARELARPQAESLLVAARSGADLRKLAEADNVTLTTTGMFTRNMNVSQVGRSPLFMGTVFALSEEAPWSGIVPVESGLAIIHLLEIQKADLTALGPVRDSLAGELLRTKQSSAFSLWVNDLYENANIKDYRSEFYGTM